MSLRGAREPFDPSRCRATYAARLCQLPAGHDGEHTWKGKDMTVQWTNNGTNWTVLP